MKKYARAAVILVLAYIVPVLLLLFEVIPYEYRFYVLEAITVLLFIYAKLTKTTFRQLGFRTDNFKESFVKLFPVTIGLSIIMLLVYALDASKPALYGTLAFYIFYVFISSPSQEFIYRSFLFHLFSKIDLNKGQRILFSSLLYSFVHIIYLDVATLVVTFLIGLYWGYHYDRFRNWYGVSLSHSILGAVSILLGFV